MTKDKTQALLDYASTLTQLKEYQGNYTGSCPLPGHDDNNPSFYVYAGKFQARCYGCDWKGDVFALYQAINGGDFLDAKKALGFWDNSRPAPRVQKRVFPLLTQYSEGKKRNLYQLCFDSIVAGKDIKISMGHYELWNYEFISFCLAGVSGRGGYISSLAEKIEDPVRKELIFNMLKDEG